MPRRTIQDAYFHKAKQQGFVARSAFKLIEINEKKKIIRPGHRVLDLGCAPGSWLQVASDLVKSKGIVVGIDLKPVTINPQPNTHTIVGDITATPPQTLTDLARGKFHVVLSDMAPNTTGAGDHERCVHLCYSALDLLPELLKNKGTLAIKVFEGALYPELLKYTGKLFADVKGFKPKACRDVSREIYIIAKDFRSSTNAHQTNTQSQTQ